MSVKWKKESVNELTNEWRQDNIWIVWENQLRIQKADDWRFALRYKRGKSGWETIKAEGEISENFRLHCEWFLPWKPQWCLKILLKVNEETSLVAQWLRIRLPMQETRFWAVIREDPTCRGATKPVCHNYWECVPQLRKPARLELVLHKRSHRNEKPAHCNKE